MLFVIAGEASGDFLGGQILKSLKKIAPTLKILGIGGEHMEAQGLSSLFPIQDLSVIGIIEIFSRLKTIKIRLDQTVNAILENKPKALLTIDSPDFCLRVAKKIKKKLNIPIIHCVAPSVWAWRAGRAKKISKIVDHLLTLFPFEPPYFTKHGLPTTFIGHPIVELPVDRDTNFYNRYGFESDKPTILILPGSRKQEITNHLSVFLQSAQNLQKIFKNLQFIIPIMTHHQDLVEKICKSHNFESLILHNKDEKWQAFLHAHGAITASGTVSLELAKARTPMIVAYKTSFLTYHVVKHLVKLPYISLVNIILSKMVVPECIQYQCTPQIITNKMIEILENNDQKLALELCQQSLYPDTEVMPSDKAAEIIFQYLK